MIRINNANNQIHATVTYFHKIFVSKCVFLKPFFQQVAIVVAVLLVMVVTAVNDWKKEKQFRGLQEVIEDSKMYSVLRSGEVAEVCERSLVVGDVIILKYGDKIPTDGILLRSSELRVDESVS